MIRRSSDLSNHENRGALFVPSTQRGHLQCRAFEPSFFTVGANSHATLHLCVPSTVPGYPTVVLIGGGFVLLQNPTSRKTEFNSEQIACHPVRPPSGGNLVIAVYSAAAAQGRWRCGQREEGGDVAYSKRCRRVRLIYSRSGRNSETRYSSGLVASHRPSNSTGAISKAGQSVWQAPAR